MIKVTKTKTQTKVNFVGAGTMVMYRQLTPAEQRKLVKKFTNDFISSLKVHLVNDTMTKIEGRRMPNFETTWDGFHDVLKSKTEELHLKLLKHSYKERFYKNL